MSSVSIKVTNNQTGKNVTNAIPVNGKQQSIAAVFSGSFSDGKVVVSVIEVQKPAEATGVNIIIGPTDGAWLTVKSDATPLKVNNGSPLDITNWNIVAVKQ